MTPIAEQVAAPRALLLTGPAQVGIGQRFQLTLELNHGARPVHQLDAVVHFPRWLRFAGIRPAQGAGTAPLSVRMARRTSVALTATVSPPTPGAIGLGSLVFQAAAPAGSRGAISCTDVVVTLDRNAWSSCPDADATVTVAPLPLTAGGPGSPPQPVVGQQYTYPIPSSGGVGRRTWATLLSEDSLLVSPDGVVFGVPGTAGAIEFGAVVTDEASGHQEVAFGLTVQAAPFRAVDGPHRDIIAGWPDGVGLDVSGGTPPYTVTVTAGVLPDGIVPATDGSAALSGVAAEVGDYQVTVSVADSAGAAATLTPRFGSRLFKNSEDVPLPSGATGALRIANGTADPCTVTLDYTLAPIMTGAPAPASMDAAITLDGRTVWSGPLAGTQLVAPLQGIAGGPRRVGVVVGTGSASFGHLVLERITLAAAGGAASVWLGQEIGGRVTSPGTTLGPGDSLDRAMLLPGSADRLLLPHARGFDVVRVDGAQSVVGLSPACRKVVALQPVAGARHQLFGLGATDAALYRITQADDGTWAQTAILPSTGGASDLCAFALAGGAAVAFATNATVSVVDVASGRTLGTVAVGGPSSTSDPVHLASATGTTGTVMLFAVRRDAGTLTVAAIPPGGTPALLSVVATARRLSAVAAMSDSNGQILAAVTSEVDGTITLYSWDASGTPAAPVTVAAGAGPVATALGALTRDRHIAVLSADAASATLSASLPPYRSAAREASLARPGALVPLRDRLGRCAAAVLDLHSATMRVHSAAPLFSHMPVIQTSAAEVVVRVDAGGTSWTVDDFLVGNAGHMDLTLGGVTVLDGVAAELSVDAMSGAAVGPGAAVALSFHAGGQAVPQPGATGRLMIRCDDPLNPLVALPIRVVAA